MRKAWVFLTLGCGLILAGCGSPTGMTYSDEAVEMQQMAMSEKVAETGGDPSAPAVGQSSPDAALPRMAYVYRYGLEVPPGDIDRLMAAHERACTSAGHAQCQVIASQSQSFGRHEVRASLELRAVPAWTARFRSGVEEETRGVGGRVVRSSTEAEDLTLRLTDTEARLRAQTALRDRLQTLLATRSGGLDELVKVESELARVQGEVDAIQSTLAVLRARVATSRLEISYETPRAFAGDSAFAPIQNALTGAAGVSLGVVAFLITFLAILAPVMVVAAPLVWWGVRYRRRRRARRVDQASADSAADDGPSEP